MSPQSVIPVIVVLGIALVTATNASVILIILILMNHVILEHHSFKKENMLNH